MTTDVVPLFGSSYCYAAAITVETVLSLVMVADVEMTAAGLSFFCFSAVVAMVEVYANNCIIPDMITT